MAEVERPRVVSLVAVGPQGQWPPVVPELEMLLVVEQVVPEVEQQEVVLGPWRVPGELLVPQEKSNGIEILGWCLSRQLRIRKCLPFQMSSRVVVLRQKDDGVWCVHSSEVWKQLTVKSL